MAYVLNALVAAEDVLQASDLAVVSLSQGYGRTEAGPVPGGRIGIIAHAIQPRRELRSAAARYLSEF